MRNVTLLSLRDQSRQRADKQNSGFILDAELNQYINNSITELYDLLVGAYGNDYYLTTYQFTTDGTNITYNLPADFYKMEGIDMYVNPSRFITLKPYQFNERGKYQDGSNWAAINALNGPRYHLKNNSIEFNPSPPGVYSMSLYYVPASPTLSLDTDTFDGINGWEEYVIIDAAIKMLQKEESDVGVLEGQKASIMKRINLMAENRDFGHSFRVSDVQNEWNRLDGDVYRY